MGLFCSKGIKYGIRQILLNQQLILQNQHELKELIMGVTEDFAVFTAAVNGRTNEISAALVEIQADIERLLAANSATPAEVLAGMEEIKARLGLLSDTSKAIAALDNPVVPPPVEPPPEEPL
jgi:hypothetical protein